MIQVSMSNKKVPKAFKKKARLIAELWASNKIEKLRELRDSSTNFKIYIYHHSEGTDSYYDDITGKYFTWERVSAMDSAKLENGEHFATVVIPYRAGIIFTKSSLLSNPSLN